MSSAPPNHLPLPGPFLADRADNGWSDFEAAARTAGLDHVLTLANKAANRKRLSAIFGNSPYLSRTIINDPAFTGQLLEQGPEAVWQSLRAGLEADTPGLTDIDALMALLRRAKTRVALTVAAADIWNLWSLETVTGTLSDFAELTLDLAVAHLLRAGMIKGELAPPEGVDDPASVPAEPSLGRTSGLIVLGMGKLGACELNYSSDIDLILLFDNDVVRYAGRKSPQQFFVRLARDLVRVMQERTGDGYVFRTDLRLRPDPGATPLAISVDAAEIYYQSVGLNWERAAMIKARSVAGDHDAAKGFLERIRGFVWRKHLDFAAIDDIHAIKKQIHRHHRHGDIAVAGQDVKLGRGGIREIEFFAQIQQLIAGGREYALRVPQTLKALAALSELGKISDQDCRELSDAYQFLRRVEHRLQMINDEQTHQIPETEDGVAHLANFLGYPSVAAFSEELLGHLDRVKRHYDDLLEHPGGQPEEEPEAETVLPADVTAPEMKETLAGLGYGDPDRTIGIIEGWQFGRYRALRTPRSRDLLSAILSRLLTAFGETADPDLALTRFDEFMNKLPSGVQILSLFQANPWLLDVVAEIMGIAPALAEQLARRPLLLDAVLSPDFFDPLDAFEHLKADLVEAVSRARDYEDVLDITRIWVNEQKFRVGVQLLQATVNAAEAGRALSDVADALVQVLFEEVHKEFARRHGLVPDSRFSIVGMGKLGGREMTFTSDLDLIFIYDVGDPEATSDGKKSLTPGHYYTRLAQTFINAITAPTAEGSLYEVDMRLRPSGNAGPLAVSLDAFRQYQKGQAWTWEHMALTRSRVCAGDAGLGAAITETIHSVLTSPREPEDLRHQAADMRRRLREEFGTENIWSVKHCRGGLVDVEFICQYLILRHASEAPDLVTPNILNAIEGLRQKGYLDAEATQSLAAAYRLLTTLQGLLRLCVGKGFDADSASTGLKATLAKATGHPSFEALKADLEKDQQTVAALFKKLIGDPKKHSDSDK